MRKFLRAIFHKPVVWATNRFATRPVRPRIFEALTKLRESIRGEQGKKGLLIPFDPKLARFIIFSDQHKGARDGADDFSQAEPNYLAALTHYDQAGYSFISLGDCEELWENTLGRVKKYNQACFDAERKFLLRNAFFKVFGNHDLYWDNDPLAGWELKGIYGQDVPIYEGILLKTRVNDTPLEFFLTHGHQGDAQSDGNWFSKFFVARIWAPFQAYLRINPNTAAYDSTRKTLHNEIMYEWASQQRDTILITGHTHQPVFASLTHIERLYKELQRARTSGNAESVQALETEIRKREKHFPAVSIDYQVMEPHYFNSGCCCFVDGDITGIEIAEGEIRLIKWKQVNGVSNRELLERMPLTEL